MGWTAGINHQAMPGVPVPKAAAIARRAGFGVIELNAVEGGEVGLRMSEAAATALRTAVEREGVQIGALTSGLYWRYSPTADDSTIRSKARDIARQQLSLAAALGARAILVVPGQVGAISGEPLVRYDVAYERAQEFLAALAPEAESAGVDLAIENVWNRFLLSPLEMRHITDEVGSERVGVYFDVGNVLLYGYPEQWIEILGRRVRRVHLKDFRRSIGTLAGFVAIGSGDADWEAVGGALRRVGYDGPLTAEVSPTESERDDIEGYVARIGRQVAGVMQRMGASN